MLKQNSCVKRVSYNKLWSNALEMSITAPEMSISEQRLDALFAVAFFFFLISEQRVYILASNYGWVEVQTNLCTIYLQRLEYSHLLQIQRHLDLER